jgi:hypothetical protein
VCAVQLTPNPQAQHAGAVSQLLASVGTVPIVTNWLGQVPEWPGLQTQLSPDVQMMLPLLVFPAASLQLMGPMLSRIEQEVQGLVGCHQCFRCMISPSGSVSRERHRSFPAFMGCPRQDPYVRAQHGLWVSSCDLGCDVGSPGSPGIGGTLGQSESQSQSHLYLHGSRHLC